MNVYCDDGSTTIKLAWNDNGKICKSLSQNSFRHGWKVDGLGIRQTFNYELDGKKYTYDEVSNQSILTTHIEYQYTDVNLLAVHHALLNSGLAPQPVSLTVTLPISEFYTKECQKNELNIQRKIENLMRPIRLNKGDVFTIEHVDVMPESLPAVFSRLVVDKVGQFEKSLVVDIGGTTLDVGVIVGQFDSVSAIHGNSGIGVSSVTKAAMSALRMASSDTSFLVADELIKRRNDPDFVRQVINDETKTDLVLNTIEGAIASLGEQVVNELGDFHHVNRVYVVGGGAPLIYDSIKTAWHHLGQKVVMMESPQTALVEAADFQTLEAIESVPRSERGELFRNAFISGMALHQLDPRLPVLLTAILSEEFSADQVVTLLSQTTGWKPSQADIRTVLTELGASQSVEKMPPSATDSVQEAMNDVRLKMKKLF